MSEAIRHDDPPPAGGAETLRRLTALVRPSSRVLLIADVQRPDVEDQLRAHGCFVQSSTFAALAGLAEFPDSTGRERFDAAIVVAPLPTSQRRAACLAWLLPVLTMHGHVAVAVADTEPDWNGSDTACTGFMRGPDVSGDERVRFFFPLPAVGMTVFRDRLAALERQHQARRLDLRVASLDELALERESAALSRALEMLRRRKAWLSDEVHGGACSLDRIERELECVERDAEHRQSEVRALEERCAELDEALQRDALALLMATEQRESFGWLGSASETESRLATLTAERDRLQSGIGLVRRSFTWRMTAGVRAAARRLGWPTSDIPLGQTGR